MTRWRLAAAWALGAVGYALGLALSTGFDLPSGPVIVWVLCVVGLVAYAIHGRAIIRA
jgi:zinc/manganese transport system permease protein